MHRETGDHGQRVGRHLSGGRPRDLRIPGSDPVQDQRRSRVPDPQPGPPLPHHNEGARNAWLQSAGLHRRRRPPLSDVPHTRGPVMKLAVVGTGYVGLVSGVCLAAKGHDVTCVDNNLSIVECLNAGEPTIYERDLPELLATVRDTGNFRATSEIVSALDAADTVLIAVGTPCENGIIDLRYVRSVARELGEYIKTHDRHISVVVKSTVVPGTT